MFFIMGHSYIAMMIMATNHFKILQRFTIIGDQLLHAGSNAAIGKYSGMMQDHGVHYASWHE
jgi:ribose/xylose/arabinose/galactoside ABC-type transport system permease subunit